MLSIQRESGRKVKQKQLYFRFRQFDRHFLFGLFNEFINTNNNNNNSIFFLLGAGNNCNIFFYTYSLYHSKIHIFEYQFTLIRHFILVLKRAFIRLLFFLFFSFFFFFHFIRYLLFIRMEKLMNKISCAYTLLLFYWIESG